MHIWIGKAEIKSTNVFQSRQLYIELHDWLIEYGYSKQDDLSFPEQRIWEARQQNGRKEFWVWWRPSKAIEGNKFWRRVIDVDMHGVGIQPAEIMYKGKKIKCDSGKFEVLLQAKLEIDIDNAWKKHKIMGPFLEYFWKKIYKKEIEMYKKEILGDLKTIQDIARRFFNIGSFATDKEPFMPRKGFEENEF